MEIGAGGDSWRRRSKDSSHLRDFIQLKEEQQEESRRNSLTAHQTLSDVLGEPHTLPPPPSSLPVQSNRTLLDIIREEDHHHPNSTTAINNNNNKNKTSWKAFTEKLRLSRTGTITTTVHIPNPNRRSTSQSQSNGLQSSNNTLPDLDLGRESLSNLLLRSSSETNGSNNQQQAVITLVNSSSSPGENVQGVGMSLMALLEVGENGEREPAAAADVGISLMELLEETDREIGLEEDHTSPSILAYEEDEELENEMQLVVGEGDLNLNLMNRCCVCMVRHKGAAFIPCGHAFCRICSRELWVQRGSCPLCNGLILEILDIF